MSSTIRISLRAGEVVYVNGAMVRVDRKTSLEFLNNVTFLLENHMLKPADADTPLKKMYLNLQKLLIEPANSFATRQTFYEMHTHFIGASPLDVLNDGLVEVKNLINTGRNFEALKTLRRLFDIEKELMANQEAAPIEPLKFAKGR